MSLLVRGFIVAALGCLIYTFSVNADDSKPDVPAKAPGEAATLAEQIGGTWHLSSELTRALGYKPLGHGVGTIKVDENTDEWKFRGERDKITASIERAGHKLIATGWMGTEGGDGMDCIYSVRNGETFIRMPSSDDPFVLARVKHVAGATRAKDMLFLEYLDGGKIDDVNAFRRTANDAGPVKRGPEKVSAPE